MNRRLSPADRPERRGRVSRTPFWACRLSSPTRAAFLSTLLLSGVCRAAERPPPFAVPAAAAGDVAAPAENLAAPAEIFGAPAAEAAAPAADVAAPAVQIVVVGQGAALEGMLRPILMAELDLIRQTCDLNKGQRAAIKAAGEAGLQAAVKRFAAQQAAVESKPFDPRKQIQKRLLSALRKTLTAEQLSVYTAEVSELDALRKRAAISGIVTLLDRALYLSADQREKIAAAIDSKWKANWVHWLRLNDQGYSGRYFPNLPDAILAPLLTESQKKVWEEATRFEAQDLVNWNWSNGLPEDDGWWDQ